jgi:tRNA(Ile)-lysidine synthase
LLDVSKAALLDYAVEHQVPFHEDATNASLDIQRNRVRHELLPLLESNYQPALRRTLLRVMDILREDADFAGQAARDWNRRLEPEARGTRPETKDTVLRLGDAVFEELPVAVQRRSIHLHLLALGIVPDFETVEQLRLSAERTVSVPRDAAAAGEETPAALVARDLEGRVRLALAEQVRFADERRQFSLNSAKGEVVFARVRIRWQVRPSNTEPALGRGGCEFFDADKVGEEVVLRHWLPGDRFQPIGMAQEVKLQDFFMNHKIPRLRRHGLVVAATASGILFWVEGLRISERFKLTAQTKRFLHWRWKRV